MNKSLLILLLGLTLVLSACGLTNKNISNNDLNTLSGQVLGYDGGDATVEALWNEDSYGTGSIKSDGTFSITLENLISDSRLTGLESELNPNDFCSSLDVSTTKGKGTVLPVLTITKNGNVLGYMGQVSSLDFIQDLNETNYTTLNAKAAGRVYVNTDATVTGACQDDSLSIDLDLKKGWNTLHISVDGNAHADISSSGPTLDWYYLAQE